MPHSFEPIIDKNAKMIILGSLPGAISLDKQEYYANPRNQFWEIVFSVFEQPIPRDYGEKCKFLLEHEIALWDLVEFADREGSLDSAIKNETPNNLEKLLCDYPNIELLIFNGTKAEQMFKKYFKTIDKKMIRVPSSSPMNGKNVKSLDEKKEEWGYALKNTII